MNHFRCCLWMVLLAAAAGASHAQEWYGLENVNWRDDDLRYRQSWALIVGINYEGKDLIDPRDKLALPPLKNAETDAKEIAGLLLAHYGYRPEQVTLLTGKSADKKAIETALGKLKQVDGNDSVLVFFAGHGVRLEGEESERAVIFPYDVELAGGQPLSATIKLKDLVDELTRCPARHKLVVLDSCYSGEIFKAADFHVPNETDDRSDAELFSKPGFQAMASARAFETASDGKSVHSPFAAALLEGLQRLPAGDDGVNYQDGLWVSRLFAYVHPEVKSKQDGQQPLLGVLSGDGEFRFFPQPHRDYFAQFLPKADEQRLLRALATSHDGNWWFREMPWFVPGLRAEVLGKVEQERGVNSAFADQQVLLSATWSVVTETLLNQDKAAAAARGQAADRTPAALASNLNVLRCEHAKLLLKSDDGNFAQVLRQIDDELAAVQAELESKAAKMSAVDLHFRAIVRHALNDTPKGQETAQDLYLKAAQAYEILPEASPNKRALLALCRADHGDYLIGAKSYSYAAKKLREADGTLGNNAPAVFRIFVLRREADAFLALNAWAEANDRLQEARRLAESANSPELLACVYHWLAWARMSQWEIEPAADYFEMSNDALVQRYGASPNAPAAAEPPKLAADPPVLTAEPTGTGAPLEPPAVDSPAVDSPAPEAPNTDTAAADGKRFELPPSFDDWSSTDAKIMFLHNLHGLAMAQRYNGRATEAAHSYRLLAGHVQRTLSQFQRGPRSTQRDMEAKLQSRIVNTLERLGDCNLFASSAERDLPEAFDDYRRALGRCHLANPDPLKGARLQLLYKQALALALADAHASPTLDVGDVDQALALGAEADRLYGLAYPVADDVAGDGQPRKQPSASGMVLALGELTTKIVGVISAARAERSSPEAVQQARGALRMSLRAFRDQHGPKLHRDQLEICLLGAQVLLEYAYDQDRLNSGEDGQLLLNFCRQAIASRIDQRAPRPRDAGTKAYLRPYFDTLLRSKIASPRANVKELLEVYWESTHGSMYIKPATARPTMALCVLGDECYLLLDLPRGASRCVALPELQLGPDGAPPVLSLPRDIVRELNHWRQAQGALADSTFELRWLSENPQQQRDAAIEVPSLGEFDEKTATGHPVVHIPFAAPPGFAWLSQDEIE